jgi:2-methylcitrate dehydratase PrpD
LSKEGLGADCDFIGDPAGLYAMIYDGDCDANILTDGLGSDFLFEGVAFKPWPTSNNLHPLIEAASDINRSGLDVAKIAEVEIIAHSQLRPWCEPLEVRRRPDNAAAAANSIPFCVAKSLVHGNVTLADFTLEGLKDAATLEVSERTSYRLNDAVPGAVINIALNDGQRLEARIETPLGDPERPVPMEQLREKFRDCCRHTMNPLPPNRVGELVSLVESLDRLDDMRKLPMLVTGSVA